MATLGQWPDSQECWNNRNYGGKGLVLFDHPPNSPDLAQSDFTGSDTWRKVSEVKITKILKNYDKK